MSDLVEVAARNNAEWCDVFCRSRGIAGRFDDDAWTSAERTPSFYPDAVTLVPGVDAGSVLSRIDVGAGCSIKDSFADLDLEGRGFEVLFRAQWLLLERATVSAAAWSAVVEADELAEWESAWSEAPEPPPFFRPALLGENAVAILARYEGGRIVAGAIANRSAAAIGLSNVFAVEGDLETVYAEAAAAAQACLEGMPVVGYESDEALGAARRAGFEPIGDLAVWAT